MTQQKEFLTRNKSTQTQTGYKNSQSNESRPRKVYVREKVAVFVIAVIVLAINLLLWFDGKLNYWEFLAVFVAVAIAANLSFSIIDRRNRKLMKSR
jgi:membrane protein YdbS with pleckstrin-like domain